jgi:hypothetical protein
VVMKVDVVGFQITTLCSVIVGTNILEKYKLLLPFEIHFICSGNREIECILRHAA